MATANFSTQDARKIFVVTKEHDNWDIVKYDLKEMLSESPLRFNRDDHYRGMEGAPLGSIDFDFSHGMVGFTITFYLELRSGYYADANIDYKVVVNTDEDMFLEDIMEDEDAALMVADSLEWTYKSEGMRKMQAKAIVSKLQKYIPELQDKVEEQLANICYHTLVVAGTFSNGEQIYTSV